MLKKNAQNIVLVWGPLHGEIGVLKKQIFFCKYLCTSCLLQKWVSFKRVQLVPFSLPSWSRSVHFVLFRYKMQGISIWNIWIQHPVDNLIWSEAKKSKILKLWASTTIKLNNERIVYLWRVENEEERWEVKSHPFPVRFKNEISGPEQPLPLDEGVDDDSRHNHLQRHKLWRISKTYIVFFFRCHSFI